VLAQRTSSNYQRLLQNKTLLAIDEAQTIPDIGQKLKFIVDEFPHIKVIATGSSVFDLTQKMGEPLVGRQKTIHLFPIAQLEFKQYENLLDTKENLEQRLIFGSYPELEKIVDWDEKSEYLNGIVNDYLLRDILAFNNIRKANKILDLLRLIALQVGKEVSLDELANGLQGISRNTIESYLDLLEKVFVIYKVGGFSRNMRKEVNKSNRWYFFDNGIRNAVIRNFATLNFRMDKGELWENYLMTERLKFNSYANYKAKRYFWRTYDQQEIDLIEEWNGQLAAFEFKWNTKKNSKAPAGWSRNYPKAKFSTINPNNYLDFIGG
jgi:predicted AAA+ superfamily ATPase